MPTYVYYCQSCNKIVQVTALITDQVEAPYCNKCKQDMARQFGVGAIRFVGSGWAKNDS